MADHGGALDAGADDDAATPATRLSLDGMPADLIERILTHSGCARGIAAANATSRLFRGAPGSRSAVEHALRERAHARGHGRALPAALPPGVRSWTEELLARERVFELACAHSDVAAAGGDCHGPLLEFSAFVDAEGGLHTCGEEEEEQEAEGGEEDGEDEGVAVRVAPVAIAHDADAAAPPVLVPTLVASLSAVRVRSVAAGRLHLLALSEAGTVYGCGENDCGQLGLAGSVPRSSFSRVPTPADEVLVGVAAGYRHSLALSAAGCAYSWGGNGHGQLGHGDTKERWVPARIEALGGVRLGGVAAGEAHTLLLTTRGAVYLCGDGILGALGHDDRQDQHTPRRIEALAGVRAVHVSAGAGHSLVVDAEGAVYSFGGGRHGELGHGRARCQLAPRRVEVLAAVRAVRACAGCYISAVLGADGSVHAFGDNEYGQLGLGRRSNEVTVPERVHALFGERVVQCSFGSSSHALFVTADGAVYSCGRHSGALGLGTSASASASPPVNSVTAIATPVQVLLCGVASG